MIAQQLVIPDLQSGLDYYVSFFPTRMNTTVHPDTYVDDSGTGTVLLDLSSEPLNGIPNSYLDTLHSDYAFIIALSFVPKSLDNSLEEIVIDEGWDFNMFPNPTNAEVNLLLPDDEIAKDIVIYDIAGKRIRSENSGGNVLLNINTSDFAKGAYCVRVSDQFTVKLKTLVIH